MATLNDSGDMRALVVEDVPTDRRLLGAWLSAADVRWEGVADAAGAMRALERAPYDVVLLDLDLGEGRSGFELLAEMRGRPGLRDLPVVIVTGAGSAPGLLVRGFALGADDFLTKPVDVAALRTTLTRIREQRASLTRTVADRRSPITMPRVPAIRGAIVATGAMIAHDDEARAAFDVVIGADGRVRVALLELVEPSVESGWLELARDVARRRFDEEATVTSVASDLDATLGPNEPALGYALFEIDERARHFAVLTRRAPAPVVWRAGGELGPIPRLGSGELRRVPFPNGTAVVACTMAAQFEGGGVQGLAQRIGVARFGTSLATATREQLYAILDEHVRKTVLDVAMIVVGRRDLA